ncbi:MAG TPA: hypothetical protein VE078_06530 [Thermoanaerobaculia bacterium]|nr:hypothetical protein [Thermoanaerobaculia bacterium]
MSDRHAGAMERLTASVLEAPGKLDHEVRKAIAGEEADGPIPATLLPYLDKVSHRAYTVTDEDVEALKRSGLSEDQIFEATVAAAFGAGLKRLRAGLAALASSPPYPPLPSHSHPTGRGGKNPGGGAPLPEEGSAMGEGTGVRSRRDDAPRDFPNASER